MGRILFFLLLGVAIFLLLGKGRRKSDVQRTQPAAAAASETMVGCAYCGLNIPKSDSLIAGGRHYCGEEHRRLDAVSKRD